MKIPFLEFLRIVEEILEDPFLKSRFPGKSRESQVETMP